MFKKQILKKVFAILLVIGAIIEIALMVSVSGKKDEIAVEIERNFGGRVDIKGDVSFNLFPVPKFVLKHVRVHGVESDFYKLDITSPEISFFISPISFLMGNIDVSDIEIRRARVEFEVSGEKNRNSGSFVQNFDSITLIDSEIVLLNKKYSLQKTFAGFNAVVSSNASDNIDVGIVADFHTNLNKYHLNSLLKEKHTQVVFAETNITSKPRNNRKGEQNIKFQFDIKSKFFSSNASSSSKVMIKGNDIQHFIFNHIFRAPVFFPDDSAEDFLTSFDLKFKDGKLELANMEVSSDPLTGSFDIFFKTSGEGVANGKILSLSIDSLISNEEPEDIKYKMLLLGKDDQIVMTLPSDSRIELNVGADELVIEKNQISDLVAQLVFDGGADTLFNTNFIHSGVNKVAAKGSVLFDLKTRKKGIKGDVTSSGTDFRKVISHLGANYSFEDDNTLRMYKVFSNFNVSPGILSFTNISALIDDFKLSGNFVVLNDTDESEENSSEINLEFDNLNFDKYHLYDLGGERRHFIDYLYSIVANKEESKTLFQHFIWLRNITSEIKFRFVADDFIYGGIENKNMLIAGRVKHRFFSIEEFSIQDNNDDFVSKFLVDIGDVPKVSFSIEGKNFDLTNYRYPEGANSNAWSKSLFRLPRLDNLLTEFNVDLAKVTDESLDVSDLKIETDIRKGTLYFNKFTGKIFDKGDFNITGFYIISGLPTLNLGFQISNLDMGRMFSYLFGFDSLSTSASMSGNFYAFGQSPSMFVKQLNSTLEIATSRIVVNNFAIAKIVDYIGNLTKIKVFESDFDIEKVLESGSVSYDPVRTKMIFRKGKAVFNNLPLKSKWINSNIIGQIDVPAYQLAITTIHVFRAYYLSGQEVENASLRIDYVLRGFFSNLISKFEFDQVKKLILDLKIAYQPIVEHRKQSNKIIDEKNKEIDRLIEEERLEEERLSKEENLSNEQELE